MYAFMKTKGIRLEPWRNDLILSSSLTHDGLILYITSEAPWEGRIILDNARHKNNLNLPSDYTRINQFPEWFTVEATTNYELSLNDSSLTVEGAELISGLEVGIDSSYTLTINESKP